VGEDHVARVAQLTQRTNQFNLSNIRRTEDQIRALLLDPTYRCLSVDVEDRFGAYGLAGVVFAQEKENRLELDTLLLSCRVLGRQVEQALLACLKQHSQARGLEAVDAFFSAHGQEPALSRLSRPSPLGPDGLSRERRALPSASGPHCTAPRVRCAGLAPVFGAGGDSTRT